MNANDFDSKMPGRLIKTSDGAWAFVPATLPPQLEPSWELTTAVAQATGTLRQLAGVAHTLPNEQLLIRPFLQREAVLSSRIEGTQTTLSQLILFEAQSGQETEKAEEAVPDTQEVLNYVRALGYGLRRLEVLPISLPLLREMHRELMRGVRGHDKTPGEFRRVQNWIGGATASGARFVPPPLPEMHQALDEFEKFLHAPSELPFLVRLACVHYQFEAIHPFLDGNGRVGRLLLSLMLCSEGVLPRPLLYLSGYFEKHRRAYYDGLLAVSQRGEWQAWVLYFLRGIDEQGQDAARRAAQLLALRETYRQCLHEAGATASAQRLLDELFIAPAVTTARVQNLLNVSKRTARLSIERLLDAHILQEVTGRARGRVFVAGEVMAILDAPEQVS
ncbi:MAG TPA: Fic family protein [Abditibacteriaceae bacterium]|jgi:Fic family protein